jgi:uncharacterized protein YbbC (DUF1343 family)
MGVTVQTGLDILREESCAPLGGMRVGLLANPASVTADLSHASAVLASAGVDLACLFGPQHGYRGDTQANMVEWEGYTHPTLGVPVHSLYGARREPSDEMLEGCDGVVIDLPDIGARPYTYLWTAVLMMRRCAGAGITVFVLDRPNPIGGAAVEGPVLDGRYASFVGLYPLPMRHGLTIGETLAMIDCNEGLGCRIEVIRAAGWKRALYFDETGLPWILPSPNIPTPLSALLNPGTVMLEGTNLSEGRGTTRPFEIVGALWIEPDRFAGELAGIGPAGATFRPLWFTPAWDKHAGTRCGGVQIHVVDRSAFTPVRCGAAVIAAAAALYPDRFRWSEPPYEYEYDRPPIDMIAGGPRLRETIEGGGDLAAMFKDWSRDEEAFLSMREPFLLY